MEIIIFKPVAFNKEKKKMEFVDPKKGDREYDWVSEPRRMMQIANDKFQEEGIMSSKGWDILKEYYKSKIKRNN